MSAVFRSRRPNSGLGNIKRGFADPGRNIDWILMAAVGALSVIGLFLIFSATRPRLISNGLDPYQFVQRQMIFLIIAIVVMAVVMWMDYVQLRGSAQALYAGT
ncbi:MAG: rod shape-determining protein RodA, partial [Actinomycetota bacterium]